ncbi:hypothetical protein L1987_48104 [Smallanthus sonchifolius]|uniref:Uncharacterized protein n=1 Tax=Smallanthus sonchifolius TaxID=185202 RepID=A0ACB9FQF0_9ASTR|nr:hypothetical protein L1987_48104 [Smallanthus sonchifolius]
MEINKLLFFSLSLALILGVVQSFNYNEKELESEEGLEAMYDRWRDHHKVTEKSPERFNAFNATVQRVHNHNNMDKPYKLSVNMFVAMTDEEFRSNHTDNYPTSLQAKAGENPVPPADIKVLPPKFDWREHDAVTHVRKWFQCGFSPMLFGVVGGIEGVNALRTGTLLTLSDQFFVDCVNCPPHQLGPVPNIAKFIGEQKGVPTAKSCPTTGVRAACDKSKFGPVMVTIDGIDIFSWQTEENLQRLLLQQPIIFGMDPGEDFHVYKEWDGMWLPTEPSTGSLRTVGQKIGERKDTFVLNARQKDFATCITTIVWSRSLWRHTILNSR